MARDRRSGGWPMHIGLLWFDSDPKATLAEKIQRAAAYYQEKYGKQANLCYVNPTMFSADERPAVPGIEVREDRLIMPNHFYIGVAQ